MPARQALTSMSLHHDNNHGLTSCVPAKNGLRVEGLSRAFANCETNEVHGIEQIRLRIERLGRIEVYNFERKQLPCVGEVDSSAYAPRDTVWHASAPTVC